MRFLVWLLSCVVGFSAGTVAPLQSKSQDDNHPAAAGLAPGLRAELRPLGAAALPPMVRTDFGIRFAWGPGSPDERLPPGPLHIHWAGQLLIENTGTYRFYLYLVGRVRLQVDAKLLIDLQRREPGWVASGPILLTEGFHNLRVTYEKPAAAGALYLAWESDHFLLETVPSRVLFHQPDIASPRNGNSETFQRGRALVRRFRCAACHVLPGDRAPQRGPALPESVRGIRGPWLVSWLRSPRSWVPEGTMPDFGLTVDESLLLARYLRELAAWKLPEPADGRTPLGDAVVGQELFEQRACASCHWLEGTKLPVLSIGLSLQQLLAKRTLPSIRTFLEDPSQGNPHTRMPRVPLSAKEREHLLAFMQRVEREQGRDQDDVSLGLPLSEHERAQAQSLLKDLRCSACHALASVAQPPRLPLTVQLDAKKAQGRELLLERSCLGEPDRQAGRPGFRLSPAEAESIALYLAQVRVTSAQQLARAVRGRQVFEENYCGVCHRRDDSTGALRPDAWGVSEEDRPHEGVARFSVAPDLSLVGQKFNRAALRQWAQGLPPARRPWLRQSMPHFRLQEEELEDLLDYFCTEDALPEPLPAESRLAQQLAKLEHVSVAEALLVAGPLLSSSGWNCMACHPVRGITAPGPQDVERGPELHGVPVFLNSSWFYRWLQDPARLRPGVEMPAVKVPTPGVLGQDLELQMAALWKALGHPEFRPPSPEGLQVERLSPRSLHTSVVVRDCFKDAALENSWCPRSFAMGFPNGQNFLIDLDRGTVRGWWMGDLAVQKTTGKTWFWEPAGIPLSKTGPALAEWACRKSDEDKLASPDTRRPPVYWLREWRHDRGRGVTLRYEVHFPAGTVSIRDDWQAGRTGLHQVVRRRICLEKAPSGHVFYFLVDANLAVEAKGSRLRIPGPVGDAWIDAPGRRWKLCSTPQGQAWGMECHPQAPLLELEYRVSMAELSIATPGVPMGPSQGSSRLEVLPWIPGYRTVRLPLPRRLMPTAIDFLPDGTVMVASLRGPIYRVTDSDGDGYEDRAEITSDYLAAPFGLKSEGSSVVVSHKPELLRLEDEDGDGFAEHVHVLASGWGYTHDYHDWTFGVVRDVQGRYVVTLGSDYQQRGRQPEHSLYRGMALGIEPNGKLTPLARGFRFPVGLAQNERGEIFVTDNQGDQNPFNELHLLLEGSRYGVPALYDPPAEEDPWPERSPVIQIPHPWVRSVNGIDFLRSSHGRFGPHHNHLVGCEYDTRLLIRMTLWPIGSTYRGACYPLSFHPEENVSEMVAWAGRLGVTAQGSGFKDSHRWLEWAPLGPVSCRVHPTRGFLYVGSFRESGWGAGLNEGELLRIEPTGELPPGILEARFEDNSLRLTYTAPLREPQALEPASYRLRSYRRTWSGSYDSPDRDVRLERIQRVERVDLRTVRLRLPEVRADFVYELVIAPEVLRSNGFVWPRQAFLTAPPAMKP
jgi:mono/diheme cytochrome c family protein/glucose/arabinose dehydrogenase